MGDGMSEVLAFELSVAGTLWPATLLYARTRGAAKYDYWLSVRDTRPDFPFTAIRCRKAKVQAFAQTDRIKRVAAIRGRPELRCGARVNIGDACGVIVDGDGSANFVVLTDEGGYYRGAKVHVHPGDIRLEEVPHE